MDFLNENHKVYSYSENSNELSEAVLSFYDHDGVNNPDDDGNVPLHRAVIEDSVECLNYLLQQPNIHLNERNCDGETPLLMSLRMKRSFTFIVRLLEAGCDFTSTNEAQQSPLHSAITYSSNDVAHELIKRGADINAQDLKKFTPLHVAVNSRNLEAVHMLLYYGADVNICCKINNTPLMYSLGANVSDISEALIDYYCDYSCVNIYDVKALNFALAFKSPLAYNIVKAGDDINYLADNSVINVPLASACMYNSAGLFKLMWPKFDWKINRPHESPFLLIYLRFCNFTSEEWLECLYLILNSRAASDLIVYYTDEMHLCQESPDIFLFYQLLHNFKYRKIGLADRITLIWMFLYLGAEVALSDINIAYKFYGFNEEFQAFMSCYSSCVKINFQNSFHNFNFPLPTCILMLDDYDMKTILKLLENEIRYDIGQLLFSGLGIRSGQINYKDVLHLLGFFSISYPDKQRLINLLRIYSVDNGEILARLKNVPEVPTLIELSRNKAHEFVKELCEVRYPYRFHDAVMGLNIPTRIKDIIRFKIPLYDY